MLPNMAFAFPSHFRSLLTFAITLTDDESEPGEQRLVTLGTGAKGRVLVVVYTWRGAVIRFISVRRAEPRERAQYEEHR